MSTTETEIETPQVVQYKTITGDIERAEAMEAQVKFDYADKKGNAEARSHVFGLRKIKGSIERSRKEAKAGLIAMGKQIDTQASAMESRVQALIDRHEAPLLEIEDKEKDRKAALQLRVDSIASYGSNRASEILAGAITADRLRKHAAALASIVVGESFAELQEAAQIAKANASAYLEIAISQAQMEEDKRAEAKRLADEVKRLQDDAKESKRLSDLAEVERKATEKAKADADALAIKTESDRLALIAKTEADKAKAKAKADALETENRLLKEANDLRIANDAAKAKVETDRIAAEEKAKADQEAAVEKAKADAKAVADKLEADRLAQVAVETAKRATDEKSKKNRERVHNAIAAGLAAEWHSGRDATEQVEHLAKAIVAGRITHLKVEF